MCVSCQTRAAVLTASQLATYGEVKSLTKQVTGWSDGFALHTSSSMVAGLVSTTATSPGLLPRSALGAHITYMRIF